MDTELDIMQVSKLAENRPNVCFYVYLQLFSKKENLFSQKSLKQNYEKKFQIRIHVYVNKETCQLEKWNSSPMSLG